MARISLPDPDDVEGPLADAVQASHDRWGFVAHIERAFAVWPEMAVAEQELTRAVMQEGTLSPALKEAVAVVTSRVNECPYCATHHTYQMERAGRSEAEQAAINALDLDALDDPAERAALSFAEKASRSPHKVTDADVEALREAGFDDRGIVEILTVVGLFRWYNIFVTVLDLEVDEAVRGYDLG